MEIRSPLASATCSSETKVLELRWRPPNCKWSSLSHLCGMALSFQILYPEVQVHHLVDYTRRSLEGVVTGNTGRGFWQTFCRCVGVIYFYMIILFTVEQSTRFSGIHWRNVSDWFEFWIEVPFKCMQFIFILRLIRETVIRLVPSRYSFISLFWFLWRSIPQPFQVCFVIT